MLHATRMWVSRVVLFHPHSLSLACGGAAGTAWIAVCASYWTAFEPVPAARMTFALAWAMTLAAMWLPSVSGLLNRIPHFWRVGAASCGMALWPVVWKAVLSRRELIPLDWYSGPWTSLVAMAIPAALILMPMIVLGSLLCPAPSVDADGRKRNPQTAFWLGVALSWCVLPLTLFVRANADQVVLGMSACLLLGAGLSLFLSRESTESPSSLINPPFPLSEGLGADRLRIVLVSLASALLVGVALEAANQTAEQILLESLSLKLWGWAGFVVGIVTCAGLGWQNSDRRVGLRWSLLWLAIASASVLMLFPVWMRVGLWSSARLSTLPWLLLVKGLIPFGVLFPLGCSTGILLKNSPSRSLAAGACGVGFAGATFSSWPLALTLLAVTCVSVGLSLSLWTGQSWRELATNGGRNRRTVALAMCVCLLLVTWSCQGWLAPDRSARLLFSGDAFTSVANGDDLVTIERADRSRWLKTIEGQNGIWTVWRQRANQIVVRRNGMIAGQLSLDPALGPQNFWSVMTAAVPLLMHSRADDVLCLGTPGIVEINTLLGFPVRTVTCVEGDREARSLIEYEASLAESSSRLTDGRLEWVNATPVQFAASQTTRTYDVIVCPEASAIPLRSQSQFTQEFHADMVRHLNSGGLFCQRMNVVDFGSTPLIDTLQSLRSVFSQVCVITTDGAEVLLLATNSPDPMLDPGIISRLETPQVQRLCETLGQDWSIFTQLACVKPEVVDELLAGWPGTSNSCVNARFTLRLASETLRWGPKWKEKQVLFTNRTELLLLALGLEDEVQQTVVRRIQDAQERNRILTEKADDQWSYRRILKDALKDRPRTSIQRVNHEIRQALCPEDQHRKDYLIALGRAAREEAPSLASIQRIEEYAQPYDPLVTDFVHFEVAHLLGRCREPDPAREYLHWMYCITYAPDKDRSVRPVAAALDLLRRNPEIVPDPAWRWDQLSYLLDIMRVRWSARWQMNAASKFEAADMQHSIEAVTATLTAMDDLATEAGVSRETWKVQRRLWEDSLVNPTRTRQGNGEARNQMLDSVRQEWQRRNRELAEPK